MNRGPARPALTFFHVLWLALTLASAAWAYIYFRHATLLLRCAAALGGLVIGVFVSNVVIVLVVTSVVIPRLERGSGWEYEVECYMRSIFGSEWPD